MLDNVEAVLVMVCLAHFSDTCPPAPEAGFMQGEESPLKSHVALDASSAGAKKASESEFTGFAGFVKDSPPTPLKYARMG